MSAFEPADGAVDQLLEEYRSRLASIGDFQRQIKEISAAVTSKGQRVKVTVGAQGDLVAIEFPTSAYKRMAPAELAEVIVSTAEEAKAKALEAVRALTAPLSSATVDWAEMIKGNADLSQALPADPPLPDAVREYIDTGRIPLRGQQ
jgi:DNA-binding protein YbaB